MKFSDKFFKRLVSYPVTNEQIEAFNGAFEHRYLILKDMGNNIEKKSIDERDAFKSRIADLLMDSQSFLAVELEKIFQDIHDPYLDNKLNNWFATITF